MRKDGKIARTVYVGGGVKSVEWIDPPKKKTGKKIEKIAEKTEEKKSK